MAPGEVPCLPAAYAEAAVVVVVGPPLVLAHVAAAVAAAAELVPAANGVWPVPVVGSALAAAAAVGSLGSAVAAAAVASSYDPSSALTPFLLLPLASEWASVPWRFAGHLLQWL